MIAEPVLNTSRTIACLDNNVLRPLTSNEERHAIPRERITRALERLGVWDHCQILLSPALMFEYLGFNYKKLLKPPLPMFEHAAGLLERLSQSHAVAEKYYLELPELQLGVWRAKCHEQRKYSNSTELTRKLFENWLEPALENPKFLGELAEMLTFNHISRLTPSELELVASVEPGPSNNLVIAQQLVVNFLDLRARGMMVSCARPYKIVFHNDPVFADCLTLFKIENYDELVDCDLLDLSVFGYLTDDSLCEVVCVTTDPVDIVRKRKRSYQGMSERFVELIAEKFPGSKLPSVFRTPMLVINRQVDDNSEWIYPD